MMGFRFHAKMNCCESYNFKLHKGLSVFQVPNNLQIFENKMMLISIDIKIIKTVFFYCCCIIHSHFE